MKRSGFTLIELLVAIALFSIVVAIASSGFVSALRTQRQVASLISTQSNVTLVLEQMAREERTGYLFCHELDSSNPNNNSNNADYCGCTISDSGQHADPGTPAADIYSGNSNGDLSKWTCSGIDYYTAQGAHVNYSLNDGALVKSDSSAADTAPQSITGNSVSIKYLQFIIFGNLEGDHWTPRITISIGAAPSSTDAAISSDVLNMETTVSAREIDCDAGGNC
jgi:prepilin-type N-terminal cleavage/methylation domain-containing protein